MSKLTEKKVRKCMRNAYAHRDTYSQKFIKKLNIGKHSMQQKTSGFTKNILQKII